MVIQINKYSNKQNIIIRKTLVKLCVFTSDIESITEKIVHIISVRNIYFPLDSRPLKKNK